MRIYVKNNPLVDTLQLLVDLEPSWKKQLYPILNQKTIENLAQFVLQERKRKAVFPPEHLVFNAFKKCPFNKVRVVIVGQDPYHGPGQAHGLCFSVPTGVKCPPSLENIFKELENDIPGYRRPPHGNLEHWCEQGVLLLNSVLTVEAHKPASHSNKGWEYFTDEVIKLLNVQRTGIIFLLWVRKKLFSLSVTHTIFICISIYIYFIRENMPNKRVKISTERSTTFLLQPIQAHILQQSEFILAYVSKFF